MAKRKQPRYHVIPEEYLKQLIRAASKENIYFSEKYEALKALQKQYPARSSEDNEIEVIDAYYKECRQYYPVKKKVIL